jgi:D-alanyl-D-alanine carboxypeptidase/D-alanyl-D-alanine-endopeptidase (penicillin-binding protein 4)
MRLLRLYGSLRTVALIALILWLASAPAAAARHKELTKRIDAILARADVARGFWGVEIEELDTGQVLYSHDADRLFTPASNTKLFTTAAALALIGPDYRVRTTVESASAPDKYGRLTGDLVLIGRGDPNLSGRTLPYNLKTERPLSPTHVLEEIADQVVAHGVKVIDGDIVADDSFFVYERYSEGWMQDDLVWQWGAPVSALAVNDNVVFVNILPAERVGERAFVSISPFAEYYHIDNRVLTSPEGSLPRKVFIQRQPGSNRLEIWGNIPLNDSGAGEALAIEEPAEFCARLLWELLAKRGVVMYGRTRARHAAMASQNTFSVTANAPLGGSGGSESGNGSGGAETLPVPNPPVVLAQHESQPLGLDIRVINKVSQNLHAEMLLRLLGREKGSSGSVAGGLDVLRGFLTRADVLPEEYAFSDGSGLSRQNLVSPKATVKLLRYAANQTWGAEYIDSLPLAGVDGTLASRFKTLPPGAVLRAKTGSLDHANALSGYLTTARGDRLVFSIMGNNHTMPSKLATEILDEIVNEAEHNP